MALKIWNAEREGNYSVPKKGSKEYMEVKAIQNKMINGGGVLSDVKDELVDNVKLYKRTKKNIKDANEIFEKTKPLQKETISNIKRLNSGVNKYKHILGSGHQDGGSLRKAIDFATNQPDKFAEFVNKVTKVGRGNGKKITGGFLPAFIIPFIPAITTALGAFATGAAGALGAAAVDEIIGDGMKKKTGGQIINPNVDLIAEVEKLLGGGMKKKRGRPKKKKGKGFGLAELSAANEVLYPLQPKLPSLDTRTGMPVPPSSPFDFLNIKF